MKAATSTTATDRPRFHFVGGKGGVGKTTCAAALAVAAAEAGGRVLVASTDPAHSLGDALDSRLRATPRTIATRRGRLSAVEIDAGRALARWLGHRRAALERIALEGTWLDEDDVSRLLGLSLPGIDELAALLEIARFARSPRYDLVVVDTAPTGHTLRMLAMPATLAALAAVFESMRQKPRVLEAALRGAWTPSAGDEVVTDLAGTAEALSSLLRDPARTEVSWVTVAEPVAVAETVKALQHLRRDGLEVRTLILNRLTAPSSQPCGHCDARRGLQRRAVRALPPVARLCGVTARDVEPRGVARLRRIASELARPAVLTAPPRRQARWRARLDGAPVGPGDLIPPSMRLVLVAGKGGVGKTTCASALALSLADARTDARVLLVSTDPAHSLGDVLGRPLSDAPSQLPDGPPNLEVREIDPARFLAAMRTRYVSAIDRLFDRLEAGGSLDAGFDRAVMRNLIDLAPPGLDELAAVIDLADAAPPAQAPWDLIVMDTAPTGHAIRLLEMPHLVRDWSRTLMAILLKYREVARIGEFGRNLLDLSQGLGRLRGLLASDAAGVMVVTRAAALPRLETVRLLRRLRALDVRVAGIVVNAAGHGECRRCARLRTAERAETGRLQRAVGPRRRDRPLVVTASHLPPPAGVPALRRWAASAWRRPPRYHQDP